MEGKLNREEIDLINHEIRGIEISKGDLSIDHSHINRMKLSLPKKRQTEIQTHLLIGEDIQSEQWLE